MKWIESQEIAENVRKGLVGGLKRGTKCVFHFSNKLDFPQEIISQ
jgi:hypothetical protein